MKKYLISAALVILVAGAGYLIYRYSGSQSRQASTSAASSSQASSQAESSATSNTASEESSQASSKAKQSSAATSSPKQRSVNSIKAAVGMNWNKYTLKSSSQAKTIKNKKYDTFEMWDEDYQVGPKILVDASDGKIYTWTSSDTAPVPAAQDPAFDKTVRTITGTMKDGAMMNLVLKTPDGSEITVRRFGIDTSGLKSMKIGDKIKVTYTGVIKGSDTSRAFITKLENVQ